MGVANRLVEADEAGTIARLKTVQTGVIRPMMTDDADRVVKGKRDGVLVEFGSGWKDRFLGSQLMFFQIKHHVAAPPDRLDVIHLTRVRELLAY